MLGAVQKSGIALKHAAEELKRDKEVVLAAVQKCGTALEFACDELKRDRGVVLAALRQNGFALKHASDNFKSDREVVLAAVHNDGLALQYATEELKMEMDIVLAAVLENGFAARVASKKVQFKPPIHAGFGQGHQGPVGSSPGRRSSSRKMQPSLRLPAAAWSSRGTTASPASSACATPLWPLALRSLEAEYHKGPK